MKVAGIIAEYNPFHNGHAFHIAQTRLLTGADYIIVVMSGDFVQRGEPAVLDKYARARMALNNGADLVIELPCAYASSSAEYFAAGAIRTLQSLGVVDYVCFGCETRNIALLTALAKLYLQEPAEFSAALRELLRQGYTYPQARAAATEQYLSAMGALPADMTSEEFHTILSSPNTILGIEYIKAIQKYHASMEPIAIARRGKYHSYGFDEDDTFASATAIRTLLTENRKQEPSLSLSVLTEHVPSDVYEQFTSRSDFVCANDFSSALGYALLAARNSNLTRYLDMSPDLSDRILSQLTAYTGWDTFVDQIKTKQMTRTRISRALLHVLLGPQGEQMNRWRKDGFVYYARALGFRKTSAMLLSAIKKKSSVPMLTKVADGKEVLYQHYKDIDREVIARAYALFDMDIFAADLYETIGAAVHGKEKIDEYRHGVIRI